MLAVTVDQSVEDELGGSIEFWPGYRELLESILKRAVPYDAISSRLDELDFAKYLDVSDNSEYVDSTSGTQSIIS